MINNKKPTRTRLTRTRSTRPIPTRPIPTRTKPTRTRTTRIRNQIRQPIESIPTISTAIQTQPQPQPIRQPIESIPTISTAIQTQPQPQPIRQPIESIHSLTNKGNQYPKVCIIYVYYERKNEQKNQTNLAFFIKYGLDKSRWRDMNITTLFVINGHQCEVLIPERDDIFVHKQDNCSDWEGWYNGFKYFEKKNEKPIYESFSYLCLINASSFGPVYEDSIDTHWLDPFLNKMKQEKSIICSPCANLLPDSDLGGPGIRIVPQFSLLKIDKDIYNILINTKINMGNLYTNTIYGLKKNKIDAVLTGEYGLSKILLEHNYKISSLVTSNDKYRIDFYRLDNTVIKNTIFIKNNWRWEGNYASQPVLYNYCIDFVNKKFNYNNEFNNYDLNYEPLSLKYDNTGSMIKSYNLPITYGDTTSWNSLKEYYDKFLYSEETILFPPTNNNNKHCVIYAHYDKDDIIKDYVINNLKILIILKFDIIFYTASNKIKNIASNILPFKINYIQNIGAGTDWHIWLKALNNCDNYKRILLINDSLILGINGIENMRNSIDIMRNKDIDLWGHWDSSEINYHYIGTPIEIKQSVRKDLIKFIENNIYDCADGCDFVIKIETKMIEYLINIGYKTDCIIKETNIVYKYYNKNISCPSHNPFLLKEWIYLPTSFAIKWKYILPYLLFKNIKHPFFNYLLRYLHTSQELLYISKPEQIEVFPNQYDFKHLNLFNKVL